MAETDRRQETVNPGYIVVFRYTEGPSKGIMTWTSFDSQKDFEDFQSKMHGEEVVAQGITHEEALKLMEGNSTADIVRAQLNKSFDSFSALINKR